MKLEPGMKVIITKDVHFLRKQGIPDEEAGKKATIIRVHNSGVILIQTICLRIWYTDIRGILIPSQVKTLVGMLK